MKSRKSLFRKPKDKPVSYHEVDIDLTEDRPFNVIRSQSYTILNLVPRTLFELLQTLPFTWFFFLLGISYTPYHLPTSFKVAFTISLFFLILCKTMRNAVLMWDQRRHDKKLNLMNIAVFTGIDFTILTSEEIREGDLILVKSGETAPADCLILAVDSESNDVYVDVRKVDGCEDYVKKKTIKETQNFVVYDGMNIADLKKHLEFVKIVLPNSNFASVEGKIKVKGSPRVLVTGSEHFLMRGSSIVDCGWVLCLVVYVSQDCKIWTDFKSKDLNTRSKINIFANSILTVTLVLLIILILLTSLFGEFSTKRENEDSSISLVFNSILLFGNLVPVTIYVSLELISLITLKYVNYNSQDYQLNNSKVLENLGQVEYIIAEKVGVLASKTPVVQACLISETLYQDQSTDADIPINLRESDVMDDLSASNRSNSKSGRFTFESLKQDLTLESSEKEKFLLGICLCICNNFMPGDSLDCISSDEQALKDFSYRLGFKLVEHSGQIFEIEYLGKRLTYSLISYSDSSKSNSFKALLKENQTEDAILIQRGPWSLMSSYIQEDEDAVYIEDYINTSTFNSLKKVVFAYKVLSLEEVKLFMLEYKQVQTATVNRKQRFINMFENHTNDLKFLAMLGLDKEVSAENIEAVRTLTENGVKVFIATREDEESALATGFQLGLVNEQLAVIDLKSFGNPSEALHEVRLALKEEVFSYAEFQDNTDGKAFDEFNALRTKRMSERRNMQKGYMRRRSSLHPMLLSLGYGVEKNKELYRLNSSFINYIVAIDGLTVDMAFKSHELLKNLIVLMFTAKAVFAHSLCPEQKKKFVYMIKENLAFKPSVMVVGIKDGNRKMINEATVGVIVKENFDNNQHESDVFVNKFSAIPTLLFEVGTDCLYGFRAAAYLTGFKEVMVASSLLLYQSQCDWSACFWVEADNLVIFEFVTSLICIVLIGVTYIQLEIRFDTKLYCSNYLNQKIAYLRMGFSILYSLLIGIASYFFVRYGLGTVVNSSGQTEDSTTSGLVLYIIFNLALYVQAYLVTYKKLYALISIFSSLIILIIHLAVIINRSQDYISNFSFTSKSSVWFLILLFPCLIFLTSTLTVKTLKYSYSKIESRISQYSLNIKKVFCDSSSLKFSKEDDDFELNLFSLTFKQFYRELIYRSKRFKASLTYMRVFMIVVSVVAVVSNVVVASGLTGFLNIGIYTVIVTVFHLCLTASSFLIDFTSLVPFNIFVLLSFIVYSLVEVFLNTPKSTADRYPVLSIIFSLLLYTTWRTTVFKSILIYSISVLVVVYESSRYTDSVFAIQVTLWLIIMLSIQVLILISCYFQDKNRRNEYMFIQKVEIEVEKSANILSYLLPEFVRKRVKDGVRYIAEDKGTVSVVFCDICEFDKIVNLYSPQELTGLIDDVFGKIDMICETLGITKIETVGKTYLACSGLKDSEVGIDQNILRVSHARRAIELGLEILKDSSKMLLKDGSSLTFKIGINSGPVTAGVVGFHKPQFSLVGDTVNTASRMASTLDASNAIQISIATFEMLEDTRGLIFKDCYKEVKGKGTMETKLVQAVVHSVEEIVTDDLNSMFNRRRSSVLNMNSTPTFVMNGGRSSEMTGLALNNRHGRSSLLLNLDIRTPSELMVKQRTRKLYKFFYYLFKETDDEVKFRKDHADMINNVQKLGILCAFGFNSCLIVAEIVFLAVESKYSSVFRLVILLSCQTALAIAFKAMQIIRKKVRIAFLLSFIYSISFTLFFVQSSIDEVNYLIQFSYFAYFYLLVNFFCWTFFKRNLIFNTPLIAFWLSVTFRFQLELAQVVLILVYTLVIQAMVFGNEKKLRVNAALKEAAEKELEKTQQLLTQMMPPHALSNLEEGKEVTDRLSKVTLLYADIVGFTSWSSIRTPREVVGMLSELFTRFDRMCVENNVYKVHTIGDCYVAMGYVNDKKRNPAREAVNMINFAESLISLIEETNEKCKIQLGMRIGVHTGDIIGGITGTKIVRYDIYGADVLIANKMESNGDAGKIAVSESTKDLIESYLADDFEFVEAKNVKIPSLGKTIRMYFVNKNKQM